MFAPRAAQPGAQRAVRVWLAAIYLLIVAMVMVGGVTRLTGSGLSMVEWRPLMGTLPPLDQAEWLRVFERYKQSPQYQQVNGWMTLVDFKRIFFWEYLHRLLGRLIGLVFFLPWLWFALRRRLCRPLLYRTGLAFVFGGLQGLLGWLMVKSGLVDVPAVSHYRLAAHLGLAFFVACWVLWIALDLRPDPAARRGPPWLRGTSWAVVALIGLQGIYGALMAGTRAGYMYTTFPTMNGQWLPSGLGALSPAWLNPLANPIAIHFIHRTLAWLVAGAVLVLWWQLRRHAGSTRQRAGAHLLAALVIVQFLLGVLTVSYSVPVAVATAHQGAGLLLLSAALVVAHDLRGGRNQGFSET